MKQEVFTTATIEAALDNLRKYGATIPKETVALAKEKKADVIISKFTNLPNCFDGYCIRETKKILIKTIMKEYPNEDIRMFKYCVIVCTGCKDDDELMKGLGF